MSKYLEKLSKTIQTHFEASEDVEVLEMLQEINAEIEAVESLIATDIGVITDKHDDLRTKHINLLKKVPSEKQITDPIKEGVKTSEEVFNEWKEGLK